jgi:hypothetical protein
VAESHSLYGARSSVGTISPDGAWVWDGTLWQPTYVRGGVDAAETEWPAQLPADQLDVGYESGIALSRRLVLSLQVFIGLAAVVVLGFGLQLVAPADFVGRSTARDSGVRLASDFLGGLGFVAEALAFVVTAVLFLMWFHRMYRNLPALAVARQHSMWRPVLVWFIPFFNIFLVPRTVQEAWDGSHGLPAQHPRNLFATGRLAVPVRTWWLAFFAANAVGRFAPTGRTSTVADVVSGSLWLLAFEVLLAASAVLAIRMVGQMQAAQDARAISGGWKPSSEPVPPRRCATCHSLVHADYRTCPACLSPL